MTSMPADQIEVKTALVYKITWWMNWEIFLPVHSKDGPRLSALKARLPLWSLKIR